ncbi:sensor histidine kinase [Altererythrobacter sp. MF3-039]|uniref:sensor histidine kinase n=1 Tax=Altererythrobacter sp. MF3-039 TaxID=3252901 RepID=UPI00390C6F45
MADESQETSAAQTLALGQQDRVGNATPYVSYFIDRQDQLNIDDMIENRTDTDFAPVGRSEPNFGFEKSPIWLKLELKNAEASRLERILLMRTNFVSEVNVWHEQSGMVTEVLEQELASPFSTRPIDYHHLATILQLEPKTTSTVWIRYRTTGITAMPIAVETNMSFTTLSSREMARNFAFYGVMVVLIFASLLALVITRAEIFLWYLLYSGFVTFYIFHRDGYAFQLFWRDFGLWNSYASLPLAGMLTIFAAQFTRAYLGTRENMQRLDKVLLAVILFQAATIAASVPLDGEPIKQMMTVSIPISAMIFLCAGLLGLAKKGVSVLAFVLGWSGIVAASAITFIAHWIDLEVTRAATLDTMRTAMVFDAVMMGIACFTVVMEWRREREKLMQDRIAAAERNASLRSRLDLVEQRFASAQIAAENSSKLVANTTHDLRQPLFALRSSVLKMASNPKPDAGELNQVEASLAYMESLVEKNLLQAMEGTTSPVPQEARTPAQRVLDTVSTIFAEDARAAGIALHTIPSEATLGDGTAEVLRVLSNFVSNAIAYSGAKTITIAAKEGPDGLAFEVTDDGRGMDEAQVGSFSARKQRGAEAGEQNPEGKGLGLSIVAELAEKLGGKWRLETAPGKGTRASLLVPAAH